jgi:hypothetical protein
MHSVRNKAADEFEIELASVKDAFEKVSRELYDCKCNLENAEALANKSSSLLCKYNAVCGAVDPNPETWKDVNAVCAKIRRLREYAENINNLREAIRPFLLP